MDSLLPNEQTAGLVFFNIFLLLLMYMLMKEALIPPYIVSERNRKLTILLMFIFVLFSFWGPDWFHYKTTFDSLKLDGETHIEDIYYWIAKNVSSNYISFRFVVWGSGLMLYMLTLKRFAFSNDLMILVFACLFLPYFSYARVSLAMALGFYGLAVFYNPYRFKLPSYLLSLIAIIISFYFHKSALFLILIVILAIILVNMPRNVFWVLIILYPIAIYFMKGQISEFMTYEVDSSNENFNLYMQAGQSNMSNDKRNQGIGSFLSIFMEVIPYIILSIISLKAVLERIFTQDLKNIYAFIIVLILLVACSSIFMFDMGVNTNTVYIRFMRFAAIPASIVLPFFYINDISPKGIRLCLWLFLIGISYRMLYIYYNNLL